MFVADEHEFEAADSDARAALHDGLREQMPILIALAARSAVSAGGIDTVASSRLRRLSLVASPRLRTSSPPRIEHVAATLRRDGVKSFAFTDIDPSVPTMVTLRAMDGQALVNTTIAHALLLAALVVRSARSLEGLELEGDAPRIHRRAANLAAARADAIAAGLGARTTLDRSGPVLLRDAASTLLESLSWEFRCLEASYDELAPLAQGLALRRMGLPALRSENDLFADLERRGGNSAVRGLAAAQATPEGASLDEINTRRFPEAAAAVRALWAERIGDRHTAASPLQSFIARFLRADDPSERREALRGLRRESFCFDLEALILRHAPSASRALFDALPPASSDLVHGVDRDRIAALASESTRTPLKRIDVRALDPKAAKAFETHALAHLPAGFACVRVGQRASTQGSIVSTYLFFKEEGP